MNCSRRLARWVVGLVVSATAVVGVVGDGFGQSGPDASAPSPASTPDPDATAGSASTADKTDAGSPSSFQSGPIAYEFNDPNHWVKNSVYTVYQDGADTVVVRHPVGQRPDFDSLDPIRQSIWYAGTSSGGRLGKIMQAERPVLVRAGPGNDTLGSTATIHGPAAGSTIRYDKVDTALTRTKKTREIAGHTTRQYVLNVSLRVTRFDGAGDRLNRTKQAYAHHVWIAEDLPFSPAFALPFRVINRLFVKDDHTRVGEDILGEIRDQLADAGLVLGMDFRRSDASKPAYRMTASGLRRPASRMAKMPSYPVIDGQTFAKIKPVMMLSRLLESPQSKAAKASFELTYTGDAAGTFNGRAVYGTNEHGDFALLLRVGLGRDRTDAPKDDRQAKPARALFLLLMRPMHGRPTKGDYTVADMVANVETLSDERLSALSKQFTVMGLVREHPGGDSSPTVYPLMGVDEGTVTISTDSHDQLGGAFELELRGIEIGDNTSAAALHFEASFLASSGLANVGSSKITQVLSH